MICLIDENDDEIEMLDDFPRDGGNGNLIEMVKVDTMDEQTLQNIVDDYNQIPSNEIEFSVRPWLEDYSSKICIDEICQFALYKCMYKQCIFATGIFCTISKYMIISICIGYK